MKWLCRAIQQYILRSCLVRMQSENGYLTDGVKEMRTALYGILRLHIMQDL